MSTNTDPKTNPEARSPADYERVRDRFFDYLWDVTQDEANTQGVRAQAISTLAEFYAAPPYTSDSTGPRIVTAGLGVLVGLALGLFVGLVLA